jgi:hypothetical protein
MAGIGKGGHQSKESAVPGVCEITRAFRQQAVKAIFGVGMECRDRDPFPSQAWPGDRDNQALGGHSAAREVGETGIHEVASR